MDFRFFPIEGPFEIVPEKITDERGYFAEVFRSNRFSELAGAVEFVQENQSLSVHAGTIRGIHFQLAPAAQGKLVRCLSGSLIDYAVDLRGNSPTFGQWISTVLTLEQSNQLWVPVGFGHAFCTLEPSTIVSYRVSSYYSPTHDKGVAWNDKDIDIDWPATANPDTLSAKDRAQPSVADFPADYWLDWK